LGRIAGRSTFTRPGLIRVPGGRGASALTRLPRLSLRAIAAIFTRLSARFASRRIAFRAAGRVGIDPASWVTGDARLRAGVARISTLSLRAGLTAVATLLALGLARITHLGSQLLLGNDLLPGALYRVGEIPHLRAGGLIPLA
jgi:hypothetical protein